MIAPIGFNDSPLMCDSESSVDYYLNPCLVRRNFDFNCKILDMRLSR